MKAKINENFIEYLALDGGCSMNPYDALVLLGEAYVYNCNLFGIETRTLIFDAACVWLDSLLMDETNPLVPEIKSLADKDHLTPTVFWRKYVPEYTDEIDEKWDIGAIGGESDYLQSTIEWLSFDLGFNEETGETTDQCELGENGELPGSDLHRALCCGILVYINYADAFPTMEENEWDEIVKGLGLGKKDYHSFWRMNYANRVIVDFLKDLID